MTSYYSFTNLHFLYEKHQEDLHNLANNMGTIVHGNRDDKIFTPVTDRAKVGFFDKEAYRFQLIPTVSPNCQVHLPTLISPKNNETAFSQVGKHICG